MVMLVLLSIPLTYGETIQYTVEGYTLEPNPSWTTGNVKGYCECDDVPLRVTVRYRDEAGPITFHVGGDYYYDPPVDAYGFDYFKNFAITGDYTSAQVDGNPLPYSGGAGTGEKIHLTGDNGLTIRYDVEVTITQSSQWKEFELTFFAHQALTVFNPDGTIQKKGAFYWQGANLLAGKDPHETGESTVPVKKCDKPPSGNIIVDKVTVPSGDAQEFLFTPSYGSAFSLKDADPPHDSGPLGPGTYSVAETVPLGWALTSATCDDGSPVNNIVLSAGETVTCTVSYTHLTLPTNREV